MDANVSDWVKWTPSYLPGRTDAAYRREGGMMRCRTWITLPEDQEGLAAAYARTPPAELPAGYRPLPKTIPYVTAHATLVPAGWFLGVWLPAQWRVQITTLAFIDGWKGTMHGTR